MQLILIFFQIISNYNSLLVYFWSELFCKFSTCCKNFVIIKLLFIWQLLYYQALNCKSINYCFCIFYLSIQNHTYYIISMTPRSLDNIIRFNIVSTVVLQDVFFPISFEITCFHLFNPISIGMRICACQNGCTDRD